MEGTNWDFKEYPHENNASLLHDIISMANCKHREDRFIIIGVSDPKSGCKIVGLTIGQEYRKEQTGIIDVLRTKKFAGDLRPEIEVRTIILENKEIDVIVILNKPNKPYYITEDFRFKDKVVKANYIYTRILDTNTPIDKSADLYCIEHMWKERFGLTLNPADKIKMILLDFENWELDIGNKNYAYYNPEPEYRIQFGEMMDGHEPYELLFINPSFHYGDVKFLYHSTIMHESQFIWLDGIKSITAAPKTNCIELKTQRIYYYYLDLSTIDGLLHLLLQKGQLNCISRGQDSNFTYFKNKQEKLEFVEYIQTNEKEFWLIEPSFTAKKANNKLSNHHEMGNVVDLENVNRVKQMWDEWHAHKKLINNWL